MHVEKGDFESTISLFLDIAGKMKDGLNARKDLQALGIRECCVDYIKDRKPICVPVSQHHDRLSWKGTK
jgi:hypothetical protein